MCNAFCEGVYLLKRRQYLRSCSGNLCVLFRFVSEISGYAKINQFDVVLSSYDDVFRLNISVDNGGVLAAYIGQHVAEPQGYVYEHIKA